MFSVILLTFFPLLILLLETRRVLEPGLLLPNVLDEGVVGSLPEEAGTAVSAHGAVFGGPSAQQLESPPSESHLVLPADHVGLLAVELTAPLSR